MRNTEKVQQTTADLVIHAGDFGFYDEQRIVHLSPRELRLLVTHSPIWRQYNVDKQTRRETLIDIVRSHQLLGDFSRLHLWKKTIRCFAGNIL